MVLFTYALVNDRFVHYSDMCATSCSAVEGNIKAARGGLHAELCDTKRNLPTKEQQTDSTEIHSQSIASYTSFKALSLTV
jgi:hypothetical protein